MSTATLHHLPVTRSHASTAGSRTLTKLSAIDAAAWVDAAPFRAHIRHLLDATQLPFHQLACLLGISPRLCARLIVDQARPRRGVRTVRRIPTSSATHLLSFDAGRANRELAQEVSTTATRERLISLVAAGHRLATISQVTGLPEPMLAGMLDGRILSCTGRTQLAVQSAEVWAETHPGSISASAASHTLAA